MFNGICDVILVILSDEIKLVLLSSTSQATNLKKKSFGRLR